ncbi:radical SAM protein [uncultured Clostridium sp.]|uniref:radical SAM protein n=1 Tax=uncultured Clostridium sp. TaxID=59620 RepID=UPI0026228887|nr:radical SAM protein [uncultured Clostridium sp.]
MKKIILEQLLSYIEKNPEKNVGKIISIAKKLVKSPYDKQGVELLEHFYNDVPSVKELLARVGDEIDPEIVKTFFKNFVLKGIWEGGEIRNKFYEETGGRVPFALLISPSMKCNLRCVGCYANDWDKCKQLSFEEVDSIVSQARDLGIHFMFVLGGEPYFVDFMWKIYEKYPDVEFLTFSNGTLFNDEFADKIFKLKNVLPMFSLEGYESDTDSRRGEGVYQKVMEGMDKLKARKIPFGISSATGKPNVDTVISEDFIDLAISKGAFIGWYFMFMPIGSKPDTSLMLTPKQRLRLGTRTNEIRHTKPYLTVDFFNDSPYVGGCIAGTYYCHITASGDVEPCVFAHFTVDNIREKSLKEIFAGTFFKTLLKHQPYSKNLLKPCMMIDNPTVVRKIVKEVGARPTDESARAMLEDEKFQKELEELSKNYTPYAKKAWEELYPEMQGNVKRRIDVMDEAVLMRNGKK